MSPLYYDIEAMEFEGSESEEPVEPGSDCVLLPSPLLGEQAVHTWFVGVDRCLFCILSLQAAGLWYIKR